MHTDIRSCVSLPQQLHPGDLIQHPGTSHVSVVAPGGNYPNAATSSELACIFTVSLVDGHTMEDAILVHPTRQMVRDDNRSPWTIGPTMAPIPDRDAWTTRYLDDQRRNRTYKQVRAVGNSWNHGYAGPIRWNHGLCLHKDLEGGGWIVTHVRTGFKMHNGVFDSRTMAEAMMVELGHAWPDWHLVERVSSEIPNEVRPMVDEIRNAYSDNFLAV